MQVKSTRLGKSDFLESIHVLSVPTTFREPKGLYVLEALSHGVPVVQPAHGAFPELIEETGGGLLVPPDSPGDLAAALEQLMVNDTRRIEFRLPRSAGCHQPLQRRCDGRQYDGRVRAVPVEANMNGKRGEKMTWLIFAALTVLCWGVYGVMLHTGQMAMDDPVNGRYKAFLFVGIAYLFAAVFGSLIVLKLNNVEWTFTSRGVMWSTIAGVAGAIGALGVILAFGSKGSPAVVMSIVFAGAPIVNAFVAMAVHPPAGGLAALNWPFVLGIVMAAGGGCLVTLFRPN